MTATGLQPDAAVAFALCPSDARLGDDPIASCDFAARTTLTVSADGTANAVVPAYQFIIASPGHEVNCRSEHCLLSVSDSVHILGLSAPLTWPEEVPVAQRPTLRLSSLRLDPATNTGTVTVNGMDFVPHSRIHLSQCPVMPDGGVGQDCILGYGLAVEAGEDGTFAVTMDVYPLFQRNDGSYVDCLAPSPGCAIADIAPADRNNRVSLAVLEGAE